MMDKQDTKKNIWTEKERRQFPRYNYNGFVRVSGQRKNFIARDLSLGGISFLSENPIVLSNQTITLRFLPPNKFIDDIFDRDCRIRGKIVRQELNGSKASFALKFDKDLKSFVNVLYRKRVRKAIIFLLSILGAILFLKSLNFKYYWYQPLLNIYSIIVTLYILSRFVIAFFYKPPKDCGFSPTVSFIIPVKNEEGLVAKTIEHCFSVDYPKERFEVIVVDDNSTDDTPNILAKLKHVYPNLSVMNLEKNKFGKREAMTCGIRLAKNEILVLQDSDSLIRKDALYYLMQGFYDEKVAAISGHAYVLNVDKSPLTKMQEVRYFVAFRVFKAAESVFSTVSCCSGSLSAYRKAYILPIIDKWENQRFLGTPATFGDDRSLTNFLLKKYKVLYDSRAITETDVPENWKKFFKQQLRWKKSWFRESLIASSFIWKKNIIASISFYMGVILPLISPLIVFNAFILRPLLKGQAPIYYVTGIGLVSFFYCFYYFIKRPNSKWIYGIYFCLIYVFALSWQTYYAILTSRRNHWGTR